MHQSSGTGVERRPEWVGPKRWMGLCAFEETRIVPHQFMVATLALGRTAGSHPSRSEACQQICTTGDGYSCSAFLLCRRWKPGRAEDVVRVEIGQRGLDDVVELRRPNEMTKALRGHRESIGDFHSFGGKSRTISSREAFLASTSRMSSMPVSANYSMNAPSDCAGDVAIVVHSRLVLTRISVVCLPR